MCVYLFVCLYDAGILRSQLTNLRKWGTKWELLFGRTRLHSFWPYYHLGYNAFTLLPFLFWSWYKETLFSLINVDNLRINLPCTKIHASICRHSEAVMGTDFSPIATIVSTVALNRRILLASLILDMEIGLSLPIANSSRQFLFRTTFRGVLVETPR